MRPMSDRIWMPWGLAHVPTGRASNASHGSGTPPSLPDTMPPTRPAGVSEIWNIPLLGSGLKTTTEPGDPP
jgi:hypothetical protein